MCYRLARCNVAKLVIKRRIVTAQVKEAQDALAKLGGSEDGRSGQPLSEKD
jgi:hypothetical protein